MRHKCTFILYAKPSQTITVSSCQSDISNQCRIKTLGKRGGGGTEGDYGETLPGALTFPRELVWQVAWHAF